MTSLTFINDKIPFGAVVMQMNMNPAMCNFVMIFSSDITKHYNEGHEVLGEAPTG